MLADVDWNTVTAAGAFVVGAILATIATLRIMRAVLGIFERQPRIRRRPDDDDADD